MIRKNFRESVLTWGVLVVFLPVVTFAQANSPAPPDVRLVIDVSGSMKRNDPSNLRQPAVELLVQLLPENSKSGVWTFGKWVNMLVPHQEVSLAWRENAQSKSSEINSVGLFTNIGEALEKAAYDIDAGGDDYRKSIILLTDGVVDIDKSPDVNKQEWRRIVDEVLPKLKAAGFTLHTIALSDNADTNLLNKLSLATDGIAEIAYSAEDLMKIFLKAFDVAAPAEQVPLQDNSFVVDSSVEEFTALIFRNSSSEKTLLVGPDEHVSTEDKPAEDVKWHHTGTYDLITVARPLEGEWRVKADMDPESRITVVSNLNLRVQPLPNNVYRGQHIDSRFSLIEDGKIIKRSEFLSLMDVDVKMRAGRGEADLREIWEKPLYRDMPPLGGKYEVSLPEFEKKGVYEFSIVVDGKTFVRTFKHRFTVRQPFGAEINQHFSQGKMDYVLTVKSFDPDVKYDGTTVISEVTLPNGERKDIPMAFTEVDTWQGFFIPSMEGKHVAKVRVKGRTNAGENFDVELEYLTIYYSMENGLVEQEEPFFEEEQKPEPVEEKVEPVQAEEVKEEPPIAKEEAVAKEESVEETSPAPSVPGWILYTALGIGNLLLLAVGYFIYRKLTVAENDDEILDEPPEETVEKKADPPASEAEEEEEASESDEPTEEEPEEEATVDLLDEEPPMEDLEPALDELESEEAPPLEEIDVNDIDQDVETPEDGELDDLDQMSAEVDGEESGEEVGEEADEGEADDDDMVSAMLKAQGLDLAEDQLDEAISSLIDDMEDEEKD